MIDINYVHYYNLNTQTMAIGEPIVKNIPSSQKYSKFLRMLKKKTGIQHILVQRSINTHF